MIYPNNSHIIITDHEIGQTNTSASPPTNDGLQCITDRKPCCSNRAGEWLFPDGRFVPRSGPDSTFYRNRGGDGTVNLNRVNNDVMMPTGKFCCMVPDATDAMVTVCVNIGR